MIAHRIRTVARFAAVAVCLGATVASASSSVNVPSFDPKGRLTNLDKHAGGEWPDERELLAAFETQFDKFDVCIVAEKARTRTKKRLVGDAGAAVLLNPQGTLPLAINTALPRKHKSRKHLTECLRTAIATAPYPAYDGPPLVVDFEFELDPGFEMVKE